MMFIAVMGEFHMVYCVKYSVKFHVKKKNVPCLKNMCEIVCEIACENACEKDNICHTLFTWFSHTLHMFFTC